MLAMASKYPGGDPAASGISEVDKPDDMKSAQSAELEEGAEKEMAPVIP